MKVTAQGNFRCRPSALAYRRMLSQRGDPLFIAGWRGVLMVHFEVAPAALQRDVPFELDLWDGKSFISLVAFTMENMRPGLGGKCAALLFRPIATQHFLNVRTYVRHRDECGIHFLAEWLTSRLAVMLGPATFGLPYRYGRVSYERDPCKGLISGKIADVSDCTALTFEARLKDPALYQPCAAGSLDEWLMERYIAFNSANRARRYFRVWHPPWPHKTAEAALGEKSLLTKRWPWFDTARLTGANYSPGFDDVWMGRPKKVI
jgi:uncharacterized protein YqjF (DUF2071 family)